MKFLLKYLRRMDKCCCFCFRADLRKGTLSVLYLWTILMSLVVLVLLVHLFEIADDFEVNRSAYSYVVHKMSILTALIVVLMFQLLPLLSAIHGVRKKKPSFIEPYIFTKVVEILLCLTVLIVLILSFFVLIANQTNLGREFSELKQIRDEAWQARNGPSRRLLQVYDHYQYKFQPYLYVDHDSFTTSTTVRSTTKRNEHFKLREYDDSEWRGLPSTSTTTTTTPSPTTTRSVLFESYYPKWLTVSDWNLVIFYCILAVIGYTITIYYCGSVVNSYYLKEKKESKLRGFSKTGFAAVLASQENGGLLTKSTSSNAAATVIPINTTLPVTAPSAPVEYQPPVNPLYPYNTTSYH